VNNKIILMTTTKPYDEYNKNIQLNAISSWISLDMNKVILINSNDSSNEKYFNSQDVKIVPIKRQSSTGVPYVRDIFESGYNYYDEGDMLCYINAYIILLNDFCLTLKSIPIHSFKNYLIGGRSWKWNDPDQFLKRQSLPIDIDNVKKHGNLDEVCCTDYFVHNKGLYQGIIPDDILIARLSWDMWLNAKAMERKATTIDITNTCFSIHPNHGYGDKKTLFAQYSHTVIGEIKINDKYGSANGTIDRYACYTTLENNQVIINKR
jgi:hypothetical protein